MSKTFFVAALAIALPGLAHAQAAPTAAPEMPCCEKMKEECCCKEMTMDGKSEHREAEQATPDGHDMPHADGSAATAERYRH